MHLVDLEKLDLELEGSVGWYHRRESARSIRLRNSVRCDLQAR